jgi:hypothetical protein
MPKEQDRSHALIATEAKGEIVAAAGAPALLARIRPEWRAKGLILRTTRLLEVDPSSACQRLFNAAIADLRQKIIVAGLDIAKEAAARFRLPSITKEEDVSENYTVSRIIDLAYRIGILARPEWKKIVRCYDIRGDLEHEDQEYEADVDDILYIFKNCIELILERDPVEILRVDDIQKLVQSPAAPTVSGHILEDYDRAPLIRQKEIVESLINLALDSKKPDIVRQNAMGLLENFRPITKDTALIELAALLQERYESKPFDLVGMKVSYAAGVLPYLRQRKVADFFEGTIAHFNKTGYQWRHFEAHSKLLDDFEDVGGLVACPPKPRAKLVLWMILCYLGEPGGYGTWGRQRSVFNSDAAAPRIMRMFREAGARIAEDFAAAAKDRRVQAAIGYQPIARRLESLEDIVSADG